MQAAQAIASCFLGREFSVPRGKEVGLSTTRIAELLTSLATEELKVASSSFDWSDWMLAWSACTWCESWMNWPGSDGLVSDGSAPLRPGFFARYASSAAWSLRRFVCDPWS